MNVHLKRILFYIFDIKTLSITKKTYIQRRISHSTDKLKCFLFFKIRLKLLRWFGEVKCFILNLVCLMLNSALYKKKRN